MRPLLLLLLIVLSPACTSDSVVSRIALGSCLHQDLPQPIWQGILAFQPEAFIFLGDNIYADTVSPEVFRRKYDSLLNNPGYQQLKQTCAVYAIWDDHDYGENDGGSSFSAKEISRELFLDFFEEPENSDRRLTEGIYTSVESGPKDQRVQFILLDTRYFKSSWTRSKRLGELYIADAAPHLTILGEAQWKWLEEQLRRPATVRIIASGIQVINDEHIYETWGKFPAERERLFSLIRKTGARGVIIVSGDRHFAEISSVADVADYPIFDMTTSGLTHSWEAGGDAPNRARVGKGYGGLNFGTIVIDWEESDPMIHLQIRDLAGQLFTEQVLLLSELQ